MEDSALLLDRQHDRVMVRAVHFLPKPIRMRVKMLQAIRPFYLRNAPEFDKEIERWNAENGTLVNYRPFQITEPALNHDAGLVCECPMSMDALGDLTRDTKSVCVVYRPPTWRQHEETIYVKFPPATTAKRFVQAILATKPTQDMLRIAQTCGIPTAGTYAASDDDLQAALSVSGSELKAVRKIAMRSVEGRRYAFVTPLVARIEPEDKTLMQLYRFIEERLPAAGHVKLARDNVLAKAMRFWKIGLRALVRSGSIERKVPLGFYFMDTIAPDYDRIHAEHIAAKSKLARLIEFVDALPEFPSRPASQQSGARGQRESAARPDGTARSGRQG